MRRRSRLHGELGPALRGERFGQRGEDPDEVDKGKASRGECRRPGAAAAAHPPLGRADDEPDAEGSPEDAQALRPAFLVGDSGDVRLRQAQHHEPDQARRRAHQQQGPSPPPVGQAADERGAEHLRECIGGPEQSEEKRGCHELLRVVRQQGKHEAEAKKLDNDIDEQEELEKQAVRTSAMEEAAISTRSFILTPDAARQDLVRRHIYDQVTVAGIDKDYGIEELAPKQNIGDTGGNTIAEDATRQTTGKQKETSGARLRKLFGRE